MEKSFTLLMRHVISLCIFLLMFVNHSVAQFPFQSVKKWDSISSEGYLIKVYGEFGPWIFQPCPDSNVYVLDALNGESFFVQDMINDLGLSFLRDADGSGRKLAATFYDQTFRKHVDDTLQYLYCTLTIVAEDIPYKDSCAYTIMHNQNQKGLACWSLTSIVTNLER